MAPGSVTLAQIRTQARQRSDMVNSQFLTDAEFNQNISNSYKELYDLIIQKYGNNYYVQIPFQFATDGKSLFYPLPIDFYKLLGVDLALSNNGIAQQITVTTVADVAGSLAGHYFTFGSASQNFAVWFQIGGVGANPNVPGYVSVQVNAAINATAATLAAALAAALVPYSAQLTVSVLGSVVTIKDTLIGSALIPTDGALPTGFTFNTLVVGSNSNLDSYVTIRPFNFSDRNRYAIPNFQSFYGITNLRYRLHGNNLYLTPIPNANQFIRIWYIPEPNSLVNDSDTIDGVSGWEEYIIVDAAIKALQKEESDVSVLMAQKTALILRLEAAAENRDAANPATISDTQYQSFWWPNGAGMGGSGNGAY